MIQQMQKMFLIEFFLHDKNQHSENRYFIKGGNVLLKKLMNTFVWFIFTYSHKPRFQNNKQYECFL